MRAINHKRRPLSMPTLSVPDSGAQTALPPGFYIVATPIGNLGDITLRAIDILGRVAAVACEDTRQTAKLLAYLGLHVPLIAYHDHNAEAVRPNLLARAGTEPVALVSDAGTPLISDPGYKLVREAQDMGLFVTTLPGPCALIAALTLSGLPTDRFLFAGFLPSKAVARRSAITELASITTTLIFYESGPRLAATLLALSEGLGNRPARIVREISKIYEEVIAGKLKDLAERCQTMPVRGEIVLLVGPPDDCQPQVIDVDSALRAALATLSLKAAVAAVTAATGLPRRQIYARALMLGQ